MAAGAQREPALSAPAGCIGDVIERMRSMNERMHPDDGVHSFNRLYLSVTEAVGARAEKESFEDRAFLERLDVVFANLYFEAHEAVDARPGVPGGLVAALRAP